MKEKIPDCNQQITPAHLRKRIRLYTQKASMKELTFVYAFLKAGAKAKS